MNIRQRFRFNGLLTISLVIILGAIFYAYSVELGRILEQEEQAETLLHEFIQLSITTEGYIHHDDPLHQQEWETQFSYFTTLINENTPLGEGISTEIAALKENITSSMKVQGEKPIEYIKYTQAHLLGIADLLDENYSSTKAHSFRVLTKYRNIFISYLIGMSILMGILSRENIMKVLHPLDELLNGVKAIHQGHYDYLLPIDKSWSALSSEDELGSLAVAFNQMASQLNITLKELRSSIGSGQEREQLLSEILNANPNMVYLFNDDGTVEMANQAMAHYFNLDLSELIGANFKNLAEEGIVTEALYERIMENNRSVITSQSSKVIPDGRLTHTDGTTTWFHTLLTPFIQSGQPTKVLGTSIDITERRINEERIQAINKNLEAMVEERTTDLQRANEELGAFAYSISHDLRSPLRAIDGFSRILMEEHSKELPAPATRYINLLRENAVMMGKLIEGLLEFSRKGRQALKLKKVTPINIVASILQDMKFEYPEHRAEVTIGDLPDCFADTLLLKQVYQNLISNAFKFTAKKESPVIEIGSEIKDNKTIYFVKDNGVGFDMDYAERLFGVFQRLHRMDEFKGTGVGLAIAQRIIHRHGGDIWVQAAIDLGAAFYFTLPDSIETEEQR